MNRRITWTQRLVAAVFIALVRMEEALIRLVAKHARRTFFDTAEFPWVAHLEENWRAIQRELEWVLTRLDLVPNFQDIQVEQRALTMDDRWKILGPGKRLRRHRGPFNGVLRCHLALKVPVEAERCGIKVGRDVAHWAKSSIAAVASERELTNGSALAQCPGAGDDLRRETPPARSTSSRKRPSSRT